MMLNDLHKSPTKHRTHHPSQHTRPLRERNESARPLLLTFAPRSDDDGVTSREPGKEELILFREKEVNFLN